MERLRKKKSSIKSRQRIESRSGGYQTTRKKIKCIAHEIRDNDIILIVQRKIQRKTTREMGGKRRFELLTTNSLVNLPCKTLKDISKCLWSR